MEPLSRNVTLPIGVLSLFNFGSSFGLHLNYDRVVRYDTLVVEPHLTMELEITYLWVRYDRTARIFENKREKAADHRALMLWLSRSDLDPNDLCVELDVLWISILGKPKIPCDLHQLFST